MSDPFNASAGTVPPVGRGQLVLVDGRTFAISDEAGDMWAPTHGMIHDDLRYLSEFTVSFAESPSELLASSAPTPLSAVIVARVTGRPEALGTILMVRRRWVASGLREDIHLTNSTDEPQALTVLVRMHADFAHVFDVKAGVGRGSFRMSADGNGWRFDPASGEPAVATSVNSSLRPSDVDLVNGTLTWQVVIPTRGEMELCLTVEPFVDGRAAGLAFHCGAVPADAIPIRRQANWMANVPKISSTDPRLSVVVEQSLADIAALRIVDIEHLERVVIAAGAPWFMTLFGRDSLLASWMTLPFEADLAAGVLMSLAELQGTVDDAVSEEQPGKIIHELRRRGGAGPFATRDRYYGTVDATPLFVMLAAEAWRWGALGAEDLRLLGPHVDAALRWLYEYGDSDGDGFIDYQRRDPTGLGNQGWKDSWDGITFANGTLPEAPIALVEVQGYAYAAYRGAAELVEPMGLAHDADDLTRRARELRSAFNQKFWDPRGWFAIGLDRTGQRIDSMSSNPGHALWSGIASVDKANAYLDRLMGSDMWTGWGVRTLSDTMSAYDPLSYHNGSVWPHDTAICAAGAARYRRWDVVDRIVNGALDAAIAFGGRPPELFAGIARDSVPVPVAYPASCSPQAWSSASTLLLVRAMLDLRPSADRTALEIGRADLTSIPELNLERISLAGARLDVAVHDGIGTIRPSSPGSAPVLR